MHVFKVYGFYLLFILFLNKNRYKQSSRRVQKTKSFEEIDASGLSKQDRVAEQATYGSTIAIFRNFVLCYFIFNFVLIEF
jgi:hypothetical protein